MADIRVGIGGWTYPPWRANFYPPGLPQAKELEFAARQFGAIEINATFYGRQSPQSWANWAKAVPDGYTILLGTTGGTVSGPADPARMAKDGIAS